MIPLIIGGATLAVVGYAVKEYYNDEGSPWDNYSIALKKVEGNKESEDMKSSKKSKEFYKYKRYIYKTSMQEYQKFLEEYKIENNNISCSIKLEKQNFNDEDITDDLESYINKISNILKILSYNLSLGIRMVQNKKDLEDDVVIKINSYANNINKLSHLKLFDKLQNLNQLEILSSLVIAMELAIQKDTIYVDLDLSI